MANKAKSTVHLGLPETATSAERILERAIQVIDRGGEVAIRTNIIAKECGVTPPILYRAFGSREGLVIAAQAERYRRSSEVATRLLVERITAAESREDLIRAVSESLDFIFSSERVPMRRLRAQVLGSAITRPELQAEIHKVNSDYAKKLGIAYTRALRENWVTKEISMEDIALWSISLTSARITLELEPKKDDVMHENWNVLSKKAIMYAIFGDF